MVVAINAARLDRNGTVIYNFGGNFQIIPNTIQCSNISAVACGYFKDTLNVTGWSVLEIKTNEDNDDGSDYDRMYAAGLLEGWMSPFEIYYQWINVWNERGPTYQPYMQQLLNWTTTQYQWTMQQITAHRFSFKIFVCVFLFFF